MVDMTVQLAYEPMRIRPAATPGEHFNPNPLQILISEIWARKWQGQRNITSYDYQLMVLPTYPVGYQWQIVQPMLLVSIPLFSNVAIESTGQILRMCDDVCNNKWLQPWKRHTR